VYFTPAWFGVHLRHRTTPKDLRALPIAEWRVPNHSRCSPQVSFYLFVSVSFVVSAVSASPVALPLLQPVVANLHRE
jgi:hypothetical protein